MTNEQFELLKKLDKQFSEFAVAQDRLEYKISGNPLDKDDKGMIGDQREMRIDLDGLIEREKKWKWTFAGIVLAGTFLLGAIEIILKYF